MLLALVRLLFPQGAATIPQLAGALAITATAGIVSLLIFQYLAELSQAVVLRGGGIVAIVFWIVKLIGFSYRAALDPENGFLLSLFGFTMGVGLCEEFVKLIPATGLMKAGGKDWRGACVLGLGACWGEHSRTRETAPGRATARHFPLLTAFKASRARLRAAAWSTSGSG